MVSKKNFKKIGPFSPLLLDVIITVSKRPSSTVVKISYMCLTPAAAQRALRCGVSLSPYGALTSSVLGIRTPGL